MGGISLISVKNCTGPTLRALYANEDQEGKTLPRFRVRRKPPNHACCAAMCNRILIVGLNTMSHLSSACIDGNMEVSFLPHGHQAKASRNIFSTDHYIPCIDYLLLVARRVELPCRHLSKIIIRKGLLSPSIDIPAGWVPHRPGGRTSRHPRPIAFP